MSQQDGFHAKAPRSEPLPGKWHKPGNEQGNDALPVFHLESHKKGTAPAKDSFQPNLDNVGPSEANNDDENTFDHTGPGATSGDFHAGHGKPVKGTGTTEDTGSAESTVAARDQAGNSRRERDDDHPEGAQKRAKERRTEDWLSATERLPVTADEVAAERE